MINVGGDMKKSRENKRFDKISSNRQLQCEHKKTVFGRFLTNINALYIKCKEIKRKRLEEDQKKNINQTPKDPPFFDSERYSYGKNSQFSFTKYCVKINTKIFSYIHANQHLVQRSSDFIALMLLYILRKYIYSDSRL